MLIANQGPHHPSAAGPHVSPLAVPIMLEIGVKRAGGGRGGMDSLLAEAADDLIAEAMGRPKEAAGRT
jgi:hypothetical protein